MSLSNLYYTHSYSIYFIYLYYPLPPYPLHYLSPFLITPLPYLNFSFSHYFIKLLSISISLPPYLYFLAILYHEEIDPLFSILNPIYSELFEYISHKIYY